MKSTVDTSSRPK